MWPWNEVRCPSFCALCLSQLPLLPSLPLLCTAWCPSLSPYQPIRGKLLPIGCIPVIDKVRKKLLMETLVSKYFMTSRRLHAEEWRGSQLLSLCNWEDLDHLSDLKNLSPLDLSGLLSQMRGIAERWYLRSCSALKYSMLHVYSYLIESKVPALVFTARPKIGEAGGVPRRVSQMLLLH